MGASPDRKICLTLPICIYLLFSRSHFYGHDQANAKCHRKKSMPFSQSFCGRTMKPHSSAAAYLILQVDEGIAACVAEGLKKYILRRNII